MKRLLSIGLTAKTPKTEPQPSAWFRKIVTGGSLVKNENAGADAAKLAASLGIKGCQTVEDCLSYGYRHLIWEMSG